ncbi:MAG: tripartite tricarboxylate transporter TctB family protein [Maritimibacter sp.]|nr:tripartite tricarboxylate transporter TctB family protein [Maritimibacter sp.]
MSDDTGESFRGPKRGQLPFAGGFLLISALLAALLWDQTVWKAGTDLFSQARFWPAIGVFGMVGFTALHLWHLPRRKFVPADRAEARNWLQVFEYVAWFLAYVWLVPLIGYLPVTLAFAAALSWRMGYRSRKMLWISVAFGLAVVILFKMFLQVKIPGAALYELLPGAVRNFFILYL